MLIKLIVCSVEQNCRAAFSSAQEKWEVISTAPGLLGQFGGWDEERPECACILSLWSDQASYDHFMKAIHDKVTNSNSQAGAYTSITVDFFSSLFSMPGEFTDLIKSIPTSKFLRVADCRVKRERLGHFCKIQQEVWLPEMQRSPVCWAGHLIQELKRKTIAF